MEKEEKALSLLLDAIETFGFSKEVHIKFVQELIKRLNLSIDDCFPENKLSSLLSAASDICSKLGESLTAAQKTVVSKQSTAKQSAKKGYSRSGKKLGRPKKVKQEEYKPEEKKEQNLKPDPLPASENKSDKQPDPLPAFENKGDKNPEQSPRFETRGSRLIPVRKSKAQVVELRELTEEEKQEVEKLKMGKEYSNDILYVWRNLFVTSNRVLQEAQPLGVFVTYQRKTLDYDKFVLYLMDEMKGLPISKAIAYARSILPEYHGKKWKILDRWQIEAIKQAQPELNQLLRKIGGEGFSGNYRTEDDSNWKSTDKIRYAVNVTR